MRRFLKENSLSLVFFALFAAALVGDAFAGWKAFNNDAVTHHDATIGFWRYVTTSDFGRNVLENWQSEYLQFTLYVLLTVWLVQKGSNESKQPAKVGGETDEEQRVGKHARKDSPWPARATGLARTLYSNSLVIVMALIWIGSWFGQSVTGWSSNNSDLLTHGEAALSWWQVRRHRGVLGADAAELAVGVPGRRDDGRVLRLPAPARLAGVQAGRRAAC